MKTDSINGIKFQAFKDYSEFTKPTLYPFNPYQEVNNTTDTIEISQNVSNSKVDEYRNNFKNPNWTKKYIPEANIIHMTQNYVIDGTEYEIYNNGKVVQVGTWQKPEVILENDEESKKLFDNINGLSSSKNLAQNDNKKTEIKKTNKFNEFIAKIWKFFSASSRMTQACFKGSLYGSLTGVGILSGSWLLKTLPKTFQKGGPKFSVVLKQPLKHIGKSSKIVAGIAAATVLAYQLIVGKLDTNQRTAVIDHKMKVGHRDQ